MMQQDIMEVAQRPFTVCRGAMTCWSVSAGALELQNGLGPFVWVTSKALKMSFPCINCWNILQSGRGAINRRREEIEQYTVGVTTFFFVLVGGILTCA
jgi:hypothetical protein